MKGYDGSHVFKKGLFDGAWNMQIPNKEISVPMTELPPLWAIALLELLEFQTYWNPSKSRLAISKLEDLHNRSGPDAEVLCPTSAPIGHRLLILHQLSSDA